MKTKEEILNSKGAIQTQDGLLYIREQCFGSMEEYASEQCQKRDELIKAQDELIKELCEEEGAVLYIKKLEDKIEQLKNEIQ